MDALTRLQRYLDGDPVSIMSRTHVEEIMAEITRLYQRIGYMQGSLQLALVRLDKYYAYDTQSDVDAAVDLINKAIKGGD